MANKWAPDSWRGMNILQQPTYPDTNLLSDVEERLKKFPPLVFAVRRAV